MSQNTLIEKFMSLIKIGLKSINLELEIAIEENCVVVKNYIIDFENDIEILIFNISDLDTPIATFPSEGLVSAATYLCVQIVSEIISREIETQEIID